MLRLMIFLALILAGTAHATTAELIERGSGEPPLCVQAPLRQDPPTYPWVERESAQYPVISKEFFRCLGSARNPMRREYPDDADPIDHYDCDGHGLPARDNEEFIYPILCDLLNYLQRQTGRAVKITCGHRCPQHNTYSDSSVENRMSKHQIGAEVDFFVEGWEERPREIVQLLIDYYRDDDPAFRDFSRYLKPDTNVSIHPWFNKEVFIKLYQADEGRDFDNQHSHSYIGIQVRWDRERKERVFYSWKAAHRGYFRTK